MSAKASLDQSLSGVLTAQDAMSNDQTKQQASIQAAKSAKSNGRQPRQARRAK